MGTVVDLKIAEPGESFSYVGDNGERKDTPILGHVNVKDSSLSFSFILFFANENQMGFAMKQVFKNGKVAKAKFKAQANEFAGEFIYSNQEDIRGMLLGTDED